MAQHAYWQGQIRISLVQFSVSLRTATKRASQAPLHEYDSKSGSRIRHMNVTDDGKPVKDDDIIKGFEADKDDFIPLEDDELKKLKLPSSDTLEIESFVKLDDIPLYHIERPYYVLPNDKSAGEIYQTIHDSLLKTGKAGIGQMTIRGREELCALVATDKGLMLETLRYEAELLDPEEAFKDLKTYKVKSDYVTLAQQLIDQNSGKLDLSHYHDRYHEALLALIEAKRNHRKPVYSQPAAKQPKVVNFMDALKRSLKSDKPAKPAKRKAA